MNAKKKVVEISLNDLNRLYQHREVLSARLLPRTRLRPAKRTKSRNGERMQPSMQVVGERGKMFKLRRSERNPSKRLPRIPTLAGPPTGATPGSLACPESHRV